MNKPKLIFLLSFVVISFLACDSEEIKPRNPENLATEFEGNLIDTRDTVIGTYNGTVILHDEENASEYTEFDTTYNFAYNISKFESDFLKISPPLPSFNGQAVEYLYYQEDNFYQLSGNTGQAYALTYEIRFMPDSSHLDIFIHSYCGMDGYYDLTEYWFEGVKE